MRDRIGRNRGLSYDGTRAFVVGFVGFCAGCVVIAYGTDRIAAAFGSSEPLVPAVVESAAPPAAAQPTVSAASPRIAAARRANAPAAQPSPCAKVLSPHRSANAAARKALSPAPGAARATVAPADSATSAAGAAKFSSRPVAATLRLSAARAKPIAPAPIAVRAVSTAVPAARPAGGLLVPFKSAPALTSNAGLDPRPGNEPLLIAPAAAAAPPDAGALHTR